MRVVILGSGRGSNAEAILQAQQEGRLGGARVVQIFSDQPAARILELGARFGVPAQFLDPGPFGCLGMGPGYALGAAMAFPDRQLVLMLGDGAIGFALGDFEALVRHGVNVVAIVGNNGIWGLEKHPMQALFGYDVVAELSPGIRYDQVVTALGGHGELVTEPGEVGPALDRAFATRGVSLVNILTDPADAYPRSSNLA